MNTINKELFDEFVKAHIADGGIVPTETAVTNLVHHALINRSYKIFKSDGVDIDDNDIELYDVVLWSNISNDPFFMICIDTDDNDLILLGCNNNGKLIQKVV